MRETRAVAELLSPSYFIQAQIFPYNYQDVIVRGNATRINALFLREYLRQRHSIPEMPSAMSFEGGFTAIYFTGVARNVWHCDVASLYPSIMLQFDCFPATDQLQIFRHLLTDLRKFRLEAKGQMQLVDRQEDRRHWHHLHERMGHTDLRHAGRRIALQLDHCRVVDRTCDRRCTRLQYAGAARGEEPDDGR